MAPTQIHDDAFDDDPFLYELEDFEFQSYFDLDEAALVLDSSIPVEARQALALTCEIPVEAGPVVVLTTLSLDVSIPVEATTPAVPPPTDLVYWLMGGTGAPWPPTWLRPSPVLARVSHCGTLILGGRSTSTWIEPARRSRKVRRILRPIIRPPQKLLATMEVVSEPTPHISHEGYIWMSGQSIVTTGIDWNVVAKQDDDELLTLLPLL